LYTGLSYLNDIIRFFHTFLCLTVLVSCDNTPNPEQITDEAAAQGAPLTFLSETVGTDTVIIYDTENSASVNAAGQIKLTLRNKIGLPSYKTLPDTMPEAAS